MTEPQLYVVRYLVPCKDAVLATSPEEAVAVVNVVGRMPYGAVVQGAYRADGPLPEAFGGPPEPPPRKAA